MLDIFSDEQGNSECLTGAIVKSSKGKVRAQMSRGRNDCCWGVMQSKPPPTRCLLRGICAVWWAAAGAELAERCAFPEGKCRVRSVVWLFLYLPHMLECQHHLLQVLLSKQSLCNRFSVISAFHCENTVRSGEQEQLLSDIQTITSFTPPGIPGACEIDAATFCGEAIECDKSLTCCRSVQYLSFQRCGLLEESIKLMNNPWDSFATQEKVVKVPQALTIVILVAQGNARYLKEENNYPQAEALLFYLCFLIIPITALWSWI